MMERVFSEALATEGTEFTERFFLLPSTRQSPRFGGEREDSRRGAEGG